MKGITGFNHKKIYLLFNHPNNNNNNKKNKITHYNNKYNYLYLKKDNHP